jgi:hypothetical protein
LSQVNSACSETELRQRLRGSSDTGSAPLMAASISLDALNVFQFFLQLFPGDH